MIQSSVFEFPSSPSDIELKYFHLNAGAQGSQNKSAGAVVSTRAHCSLGI